MLTKHVWLSQGEPCGLQDVREAAALLSSEGRAESLNEQPQRSRANLAAAGLALMCHCCRALRAAAPPSPNQEK